MSSKALKNLSLVIFTSANEVMVLFGLPVKRWRDVGCVRKQPITCWCVDPDPRADAGFFSPLSYS